MCEGGKPPFPPGAHIVEIHSGRAVRGSFLNENIKNKKYLPIL